MLGSTWEKAVSDTYSEKVDASSRAPFLSCGSQHEASWKDRICDRAVWTKITQNLLAPKNHG